MTDPHLEYPYNIPGAQSPSHHSEYGTPAPSAHALPSGGTPSDPKPGLKPDTKQAVVTSSKKPGPAPLLIVALVVVGFVAAGFLFSFLSKMLAERRAASARQAAPAAPKKVQTVIEEVPAEEGEVTNLAAVTKAKSELPALTLGGIIYSETEKSVALINGKIVSEGEMVKGVKLVRVLPDKVELEFEGRRIFMRSL